MRVFLCASGTTGGMPGHFFLLASGTGSSRFVRRVLCFTVVVILQYDPPIEIQEDMIPFSG